MQPWGDGLKFHDHFDMVVSDTGELSVCFCMHPCHNSQVALSGMDEKHGKSKWHFRPCVF